MVYNQNEDEVFEENGVIIQRIKNIKIKGLSRYLTQKKIEKLINGLYDEGQVDLIEAPDWTGMTSFIQPKVPLIVRLNGSDTYFCHLDNRPVKWLNKFHEKRALSKAKAHISVSTFTAMMTNKVFGFNIDFTVIPNGVSTALFKRNKADYDSENKILYFGTLIRKKGAFELPLIFNEVIKKNPNAELFLVGSDSGDIKTGSNSTWALMQPLFNEKALKRVHYLGKVPYEEVQNHIAETTVCIFPTFAEALPVSWLEAMAMEKAIVASDIGWGKEIVDDQINGFLAHPTDHTKNANCILELLNDKIKRQGIERMARQKVLNHFDSSVVADESIQFYKKVVDDNSLS
ncbi:group 1 glycosyl transferase [Flavobacterium enshiense DK69]|nr:group 1 glycosyl transferase [Flavobacterium enshiense DK69]